MPFYGDQQDLNEPTSIHWLSQALRRTSMDIKNLKCFGLWGLDNHQKLLFHSKIYSPQRSGAILVCLFQVVYVPKYMVHPKWTY